MTNQDHNDVVQKIQSDIGYHENLPELLSQALTHRSWINEHLDKDARQWHQSNERLEFLGDTVLGLVIAEMLYKYFNKDNEGRLSKAKAYLVSAPVLAKIAKMIDIGPGLRLGQGEKKNGGASRDSILADALEAVIGAIYLVLGLDKAVLFIKKYWFHLIDSIALDQQNEDYKTLLQETTQKYFGILPEYRLLSVAGPDHNRFYEVGVLVGDEQIGSGQGKSKKEAEQHAASQAIKKIKKQTMSSGEDK